MQQAEGIQESTLYDQVEYTDSLVIQDVQNKSALSSVYPQEEENNQDSSSLDRFLESFLQDEQDEQQNQLRPKHERLKVFSTKNANDEQEDISAQMNFEIREYQLELYKKGRGKNSIIYLETGTGKTLILVMLMWHQLNIQKNKKVVFLANTIQLVEQQENYFRKHIPKVAEILQMEYPDTEQERKNYLKRVLSSIRIIHGQKYPDHWNRVKWRQLTKLSSVFFMTSQLFLNALRKGQISLDEISILVFDECHATTEGHPYNNIMREFYFGSNLSNTQSLNPLPIVIGATASPVVSGRTIEQGQIYLDLLNLCANLDSRFLYIEPEVIKQYLKEAKVEFQYFKHILNNKFLTEFSENYRNEISDFFNACEIIKQSQFCPQFTKIKEYLEKTIQKLKNQNQQYPIVIDLLEQTYSYLIKEGIYVLIEIGPYAFKIMTKFIYQKVTSYIQEKSNYLTNDIEIRVFLQSLQEWQYSMDQQYQLVEESVSPKFEQFLKLLKKSFVNSFQTKVLKENFQLLLFCKKRIMAEYLEKTLQEFLLQNQMHDAIQSEFIVGFNFSQRKKFSIEILKRIDVNQDLQIKLQQAYWELFKENIEQQEEDQVFKDVLYLNQRVSSSSQKQIIEKFRNQKLQILIATTVAEEGMDISNCKYVVAFNSTQSSKTFVQMKGRARAQDSFFILLIPEQSVDEQKVKTQQDVQQMTKWGIKQLQSADQNKIQMAIKKIQGINYSTKYYEQYLIEKTKANINTNWSESLLMQLCQSIDKKNQKKNKPIYKVYIIKDQQQKEQFVSFVVLPQKLKSFVFKGTIQRNKDDSKASVALKACVQLYSEGYYLDDLNPSFQTNIGLHIGGAEDDQNIEQSEELLVILKRFQMTVITLTPFGMIKLRQTKRFFLQQNSNLLIDQSIQKWNRVQILYNNSMTQFICSNRIFQILKKYQVSSYFDIQVTDCIPLSEESYQDLKKQYIYSLISQNELKLYENIYQRENDQLFYEICKDNYSFLYNDQNAFTNALSQKEIEKLYYNIIYILKISNLYESLQDQFYKINEAKQTLTNFMIKPSNSILSNYVFLKNKLTFSLSNKQKTQMEIPRLLVIPQFQIEKSKLDEKLILRFLKSSLSPDEVNQIHISIGQMIYRLIISFDIFIQNLDKDLEILKAKSKKFFSYTFIKYQLIQKTLLQNFFQIKETKNNFVNYQPGLKVASVVQTDFERDVKLEKHEEQSFLQKSPFYVHLSNRHFSSFLFNCLFEIFIHQKDNSFENCNSFMEIIGIYQKGSDLIQQSIHDFLARKDIFFSDKDNKDLEQYYNDIQMKIGYKFNNFMLLFQALTDGSFKKIIVETLCPEHLNNLKDQIQIIQQDLIEIMYKQMEKVNGISVLSYSNDNFVFLGKFLWDLLVAEILVNSQYNENQDVDYFTIGHKNLTQDQTLAFMACKLNIPLNLNVQDIRDINKIFQLVQNPINQQSRIFQISMIPLEEGTQILCKAFQAVIGAIYIDSNGNYPLLQNLAKEWIFYRLQIDALIKPDYIKQSQKFKFYKWYRINFGDPAAFDLYKIPHQNYKIPDQQLYVPYDTQKGEIVNLLQERFNDIEDLQIYAPDKRKAWQQILKFTPPDFVV